MRRAHELAVDRRLVYRVSFTVPRTIQLDQVNIDPATLAATFVFQSRIDLPTDISFAIAAGIPTSAATVPEGATERWLLILPGTSAAADQVYFQRDGRALDTSNRLNNGLAHNAVAANSSCKAVLWSEQLDDPRDGD
jgi:hypothetical protein